MVTEMDRNFLNDNFLESEDWAFMNESKMDDLPHFLKLDDGYAQYELQCGLLDPGMQEDPWKDVSDGSDSGVDTLSMKPEPLSPSSLSDAKAEPYSPLSVVSDTSCDSVLYTVPAPTVDMDTCIDSVTEITQEEWDSIQSVLFESNKSALVQQAVADPSIYTCVSASNTDCEPVTLTSDLLSSVTSKSNIQTIAIGSCKQPIQTVRNISFDKKSAKIVSMNNQVVVNTGSVGHVLNSRIRIQPKPLTTTHTTVSDTPSTAVPSSRPVITVTLPALNNTPPGHLQLSNIVATPVNTSPVMLPAASPPCENYSLDNRAIKRHQRMIKNRESACLSRKRKKDYVQSLEQQLYTYNVENERLKTDNMVLKRKVEQLQTENDRLKRLLPVSKATGAVLLCALCFLSFNSLPLLMSSSKDATMSAVRPAIHTGRSLLSVNTDSNDDNLQDVALADLPSVNEHRKLTGDLAMQKGGLSLLQDVTDLMLSRRREGSGFSGRFMCSQFFNSTESLRLVSELEGWVLSHEVELRRQRELIKMEQAKAKPRKKYYAPRRLKAAMDGNLQTHNLPSNRYELQVFKGANLQYEHFMEAINRRNDTFYVVSFRRDHLLLPATAHNSTMRPRMSVMMPAVSLNETMQAPVGSIAMMQIDCEVTATRLIHIEKSAVPAEMLNRTVAVNEPNVHSGRDWLSPGRH